MVVVKTAMKSIPETCDECSYFSTRPHPYKGWTEACELCVQCLDDDQESGWIYDGDSRPKNCPLLELKDEKDCEQYRWHDLRNNPNDVPTEYSTVEVILSTIRIYDMAVYCAEYGFRPWYAEHFQECPEEWKHKVMAWRYIEPFATDANVGDKEEK